jgi:hypothetical protein
MSQNAVQAVPAAAATAACTPAPLLHQAASQPEPDQQLLLLSAPSPPGTNYISSKTAGLVAGVASKGGGTSNSWYLSLYHGSKPPRREDVQSLRQWLQQQMQQVRQEQQQQPQPQNLQHTPPQFQQQQQRVNAPPASTSGPLGSQSPARAVVSALKQVNQLRAKSAARATSALASTTAVTSSTASTMLEAGATGICDERLLEVAVDQEASQLLLMALGPAGTALQVECLQLQEAIYSAAFDELCR